MQAGGYTTTAIMPSSPPPPPPQRLAAAATGEKSDFYTKKNFPRTFSLVRKLHTDDVASQVKTIRLSQQQ